MSFFEKVKLVYQLFFDKSSLVDFEEAKNENGYSDISQKIELFGVLNVPDASIMLHAYKEFKTKYPDFSPLFIFEDPAQCEYTNGHASGGDFYFDEDELVEKSGEKDLPLLRYKYVLERLNDPEKKLSFSEIAEVLDYQDEDEIKAFDKINNLNSTPVYEDTLVYLLPTKDSKEIFARMINGYFASDLQPRQTYALISHLVDNYGYTFMGMGASLLMFVREKDLELKKSEQLLADLSLVYNIPIEKMKKIGELFCVTKHLVLPYIESLGDIAFQYEE